MKSNIMLHIIKAFFCLLLSPFRALHNWCCKKRLRKYLLPTKVSEEDLIKPQKHNDIHEKVGLVSPNNPSEDHIVDFDQAWSNNWDTEGEQNVNQKSSQINPVNKIEQYRSEICRQKSRPVDATEIEPDVNFFAEMEPENIAQAKIFVGGNGSNLSERKNRLSFSMNGQVPEEKSNGDPVSSSDFNFYIPRTKNILLCGEESRMIKKDHLILDSNSNAFFFLFKGV